MIASCCFSQGPAGERRWPVQERGSEGRSCAKGDALPVLRNLTHLEPRGLEKSSC